MADARMPPGRRRQIRACDCEITAHAKARAIQHQPLPGFRRKEPAGPDVSAIKCRIAACAGESKPAIAGELYFTLAEGDLKCGSIRRVADQRIGNLQRRAIERAAVADARLTQADALTTLQRGVHPRAMNC